MTENEKINEALEDFEMFCKGKILCITGEALEMIRTAVRKSQEYQAIGTIEDFKALKEKMEEIYKIAMCEQQATSCEYTRLKSFEMIENILGIH